MYDRAIEIAGRARTLRIIDRISQDMVCSLSDKQLKQEMARRQANAAAQALLEMGDFTDWFETTPDGTSTALVLSGDFVVMKPADFQALCQVLKTASLPRPLALASGKRQV